MIIRFLIALIFIASPVFAANTGDWEADYNSGTPATGDFMLFQDINDSDETKRTTVSGIIALETNNLEDVATGIASGEIYVGNAADDGIYVAPTGDVTISNTGVTTIGAEKIDEGMMNTASVDLASATITGTLPDGNVANDITLASTKKISTTITTEQLRLNYDAANYFTVTVDAEGATTFVTVDEDAANGDMTFSPDGTIVLTPATDVVAAFTAGTVTSDGTVAGTTGDFSAGVDLGTSQALTGTTAMTVGSGAQTIAINSSDWDISTTGAITNASIAAADNVVEADTVTNATLTTALTVNTGTVTLTGNVANNSVLTIGAGAVGVSGSNTGDNSGTDDQTLAEVLNSGADGNDVDQTSLGKLEFYDAGLYLDADADGVMDITSDGTLELHSNDWDISTTGAITNVSIAAADNVVEADTVTNATLTTALTVNTGTLTLTANVANNSVLTIGAGAVGVSGSNTGDNSGTDDQTFAEVLGQAADGGDIDQTSLGKLEFYDAGLYLDADADGVMDITSDGTLELHSSDWDISTTGVITNAALSADQISTANLDIGASTFTVNSVEIVGSDGEVNSAAVEDSYLKNDGDVATGVYDFGGATTFEIVNKNADPAVTGQILLDTTVSNYANGALRYFDGTAIRHVLSMVAATAEACTDDQVAAYDADSDLWYCKEDSTGAGSLGSNLSSTTNDITTDNTIIQLVGNSEDVVITFEANAVDFSTTTAVADFDFNAINLGTSGTISGGAVSGTTITGTGKISTTVTTEQLRLNYDAANYLTATVDAEGATVFTTVDEDAANADMTFSPDGTIILTPATDVVGAFTAGTVTSDAGVSGTTITGSTSVITNLIDTTGAADLDIGSADITDITFLTDGDYIFTPPADTDITLTFTGTTATGVFKWMEDEDSFQFADKVIFDLATTFTTAPILAADSVDAITEVAAALKSGDDGTFITGTAGTDTYAAVWNADGDLVDGAGVPYVAGGTDVADADVVDDLTITSTKKISTTVTTEQLRLSYDATNYLTATVDAEGATVITTVDADAAAANLTFSPDGTIILTPATDVVGDLTANSVTSDDLVTATTNVVIADAGNVGSASDTDAIAIAADGKTTFSQDMNLSEDLLIADAKYIGSASDPDAMQIEADGDIVMTQDLDVVVALTAGSVASDGDVSGTTITASTGFALGDGDYIGVTGNEIITFNTAGSINVTGATVDVDGAFTAATVTSDAGVTGTVVTGSTSVITNLIDTTGAADIDYGSPDVTDHTFITDGGADSIIIGNNADLDYGITIDSDTDDFTLNWDEANSELELDAPNYRLGANADEDIVIVLDTDTDDLTITWDEDDSELIIVSAAGEDLAIDFNTATDNEIALSSPDGATDINFGTLNLATTGTIQGRIIQNTDANGMSQAEMTAVGMDGTMFWASGAGTWLLPDALEGMTFCVFSTTAAAVVLDPDANDDITLDGTLLDNGDEISNDSGAGEYICLMAQTNTHWFTLGRSGTWSDDG